MTPCKQECLYERDFGCCISCGRTLDDLNVWSKITPAEQRYRIAKANERLNNLKDKGVIFDDR